MKTIFIFSLFFCCNNLFAQKFQYSDNLVLSEISKKEYSKSFKRSRKSFVKYHDGTKQSPKMFFLIESLPKEIKEYAKMDELGGWGYYELDSTFSKFRFLLSIGMPINDISYLIDKNGFITDSIIIEGHGQLTKNNIYFTAKQFDCDESVHLNWYQIFDDQVKYIAYLKEDTFHYIMAKSSRVYSSFADNEGNFYCAIENKFTHKKKYYKIKFK